MGDLLLLVASVFVKGDSLCSLGGGFEVYVHVIPEHFLKRAMDSI